MTPKMYTSLLESLLSIQLFYLWFLLKMSYLILRLTWSKVKFPKIHKGPPSQLVWLRQWTSLISYLPCPSHWQILSQFFQWVVFSFTSMALTLIQDISLYLDHCNSLLKRFSWRFSSCAFDLLYIWDHFRIKTKYFCFFCPKPSENFPSHLQ